MSPPRTGLRLALTAAGFAIGLTAVIALGLGAKPAGLSPVASEAAVETVAPTPSISCGRDQGTLPVYLANDPCPSAILAVELAVATVRLPIVRMVIEPGPLFCDVIWEGYGTPPPCRGAATRPGQFMHAYVAFRGTDKVAVVMLGLDLPDNENDPRATRPPWNTTLVAVAIPPAGWVMP
ncbi:MAG: hypothetical protein QOI92_2915 [Chloroflexota bacterium]|nr:hypothetical protein [Chloroflexota bacterium]